MVKDKRKVSLLEARKIVGTYIGESNYASVARKVDTTNQNNKYRTQAKSEWLAKVSGAPEKLHSAKFNKHQLSNRLGMEREPIL